MSEYTSTRAGFQRAMEWSLTGPPNEAKPYVEALSTPDFYHIMNGQRLSYDVYVKGIEEWRVKVSNYEPMVYVLLYQPPGQAHMNAIAHSSPSVCRGRCQLARCDTEELTSL